MKTTHLHNVILATVCTLAVAIAGLATARAEKGAEALVRMTKSSLAVTATGSNAAPVMMAHRCPSCTDFLVATTDKATKGPNHETRKVALHGCTACSTRIMTQGAGKEKQEVAVHSCGTAQSAPTCCAKN